MLAKFNECTPIGKYKADAALQERRGEERRGEERRRGEDRRGEEDHMAQGRQERRTEKEGQRRGG
ncbi:unnamed protein product [Pleuronectes platessa]|uniref:Uncharacterized protein n=1 Tax=Pleuronectes platessa TaxID=8262 RepID=A0A9N7TNU5_PLEPL|nr:unnamed protein product [Pleuronectes platessa]